MKTDMVKNGKPRMYYEVVDMNLNNTKYELNKCKNPT